MSFKPALSLLGLTLLLSACAASNPEKRSLLLSYDGPLPSVQASSTSRAQLVVRGVDLADYLDRRTMLFRSSSNELKAYSNVEWAERPSKSLTRWVAQALAAQRSDYQVQALTTGDRLPDAVLAITIDSAEAGADQILRLRGSYALITRDATEKQDFFGRFDADAPVADNYADASVKALQAALGTAVANLSRALPPAPSPKRGQ